MRNTIRAWNWCKTRWSRLNDWIMRGEPRKSVPLFASPVEAAEYLMAKAHYVPDPLGGALDWYVHPERLQAAMEDCRMAVARIPGVDCEDWATWAYVALLRIPGCKPRLLTLGDTSGRWGHHVICVYSLAGKYGAIDVSGHRALADLDEARICALWTSLNNDGTRYTEAVPTAYPF